MSGTLVFEAATQRTPSGSPGSGGQGSLQSWVPGDCNNLRDSSWQITNPADCTDSSLKHTPSLSMKDIYLLIQELQSEGQDSGFPYN